MWSDKHRVQCKAKHRSTKKQDQEWVNTGVAFGCPSVLLFIYFTFSLDATEIFLKSEHFIYFRKHKTKERRPKVNKANSTKYTYIGGFPLE